MHFHFNRLFDAEVFHRRVNDTVEVVTMLEIHLPARGRFLYIEALI